MPDRIVRVGILTSDPVNSLSWAAEVFYRRLFNVVDDFGRYDARPSLLRSHLYPLKVDRVSDSDVGKWLTECVNAGLVSAYQVSGRPFLEVQKFGQRVRANESKWPPPPTSADSCQQPLSNAPVFVCVDEFVDVDEKTPRKRAAPSIEKPEDVEQQTWDDWVALRKAKKTTVSLTAINGARTESSKAGISLERFLQIWCARGSQGLMAEWLKPDEIRRQEMRTMTVPSSPERDPALVKLDNDAKVTRPPSLEELERMAELRRKVSA